jgi:hypothetical protein
MLWTIYLYVRVRINIPKRYIVHHNHHHSINEVCAASQGKCRITFQLDQIRGVLRPAPEILRPSALF